MKTFRILLTGCALLAVWPALAQEPRPAVELIVAPGEASAVPFKRGVSYANGGIIDVARPDATTIVVTMTGLTATNADLIHTSVANYHFELAQGFELLFNSPRVKGATMTLEGRVIGILRTDHQHYTHPWGAHHCGTATTEPAVAGISVGHAEILSVALPARAAGCCEDLSVYNHEGPLPVPVTPGKFMLQGTWGFGTTHPPFCCRGASAEFAPQPEYCPENYWFTEFKPFNGTATKDSGFQIVIKVIPEFKAAEEKEEMPPPPKKEEKKEEKKEDKKDDKKDEEDKP